MLHRFLFAVSLSLGVSSTSGDTLYDYEAFRCIPEIGFFEYTRVYLYNEDNALRHGFQESDKADFECDLDRDVRIVVTPTDLKVTVRGRPIFHGPKHLDIVRVQTKESFHIELCAIPSEIATPASLFQATGGCIFRGLNAPRDKPYSADVLRRALKEANAP